MTREERENALHCLKVMVDEEVCEECKLYGSTGTDHCEADCIRVAIKALEQEPKTDGDCISREWLKTAIHNFYQGLTHTPTEEDIQAYIDVAPYVNPQEPKTEWIPVSERLPKKDESVLLTICANSSLYGFNENFVKVMCGSYSPCEDKRDWVVNGVRYYIDNVIAWCDLPKPYSEVRE